MCLLAFVHGHVSLLWSAKLPDCPICMFICVAGCAAHAMTEGTHLLVLRVTYSRRKECIGLSSPIGIHK